MKRIGLLFLATLIVCPTLLMAQIAKLPISRTGQIKPPYGKIAVIHDSDLWVMDWDGKNQFKVVTAQNADGRISWSPNGKQIAFCRRGTVDVKGPDFMGGKHRVYDIFIGFIDSAHTNNNWWRRLTSDFGSRHPEWSADGKSIVFTKDLNANMVNAIMPDYQTCIMDTSGKILQTLSHEQKFSDRLATMPTMGPNGNYAFVFYKGTNPVGVVVATANLKSFSESDLKANSKLLPKATAPAWSPDGNWIAYVDNDAANQAMYIIKPDLTEKFLVYKPGAGQVLQTYQLSWSPDSKWLTFAVADGSVWIIDITGNGLRQVMPPGSNIAPAWSKN